MSGFFRFRDYSCDSSVLVRKGRRGRNGIGRLGEGHSEGVLRGLQHGILGGRLMRVEGVWVLRW